MILKYSSSSINEHTVSYCAKRREVFSYNIAQKIPQLENKISINGEKSFVYKIYISSSFLDEKVNTERTGFNFNFDDGLDFGLEPKRIEIDDEIIKIIENVANNYIQYIEDEKIKNITTHVEINAPQYRILLNEKYKKYISKIKPKLTGEKLDSELYKAFKQIEEEHRVDFQNVRENFEKILSKDNLNYKETFEYFFETENELGKAALSKYVIHRRTILELLETSLKIKNNDKFVLEDVVHSIVYPMIKTSDEVHPDDQNLWVIDERLAFHKYLASDMPLQKMKLVANSSSTQEPDILTLHTPTAFTTDSLDYDSIVIIEFKRPERDDYNVNDNPIDQIFDYVDKIKQGRAKDKYGSTIEKTDAKFYCYVVCTLNTKIRNLCKRHDMKTTIDGEGYFRHHEEYNAYIEVISIKKLISDAKKRNKILFEKLNMPI